MRLPSWESLLSLPTVCAWWGSPSCSSLSLFPINPALFCWELFSREAKFCHKRSLVLFQLKQVFVSNRRDLEPEKLWFTSQLGHLLCPKLWKRDLSSAPLCFPGYGNLLSSGMGQAGGARVTRPGSSLQAGRSRWWQWINILAPSPLG